MQELVDLLGEARGYANLGNVRGLQKNWDGAQEQYFKSLELMEKQENRPGIAQQCESLGDVFIKKDEFDQAEDYLMRASDLYEEMKEQGSVQEVQNKLMFIFSQPKYLESRKLQIREALQKPEAEKDSKLKLALLSDLGNVLFMANDWDEAGDVAKETVAIHEKSRGQGCIERGLGKPG